MSSKRILFAVLCVLLVLVIVMTGIVIHKVSSLFQTDLPSVSTTEGSSPPTNTEAITENTEASQPEESSVPTEPAHEHEYSIFVKTVKASCDTLGYTEYACSCGSVTFRDFTDAMGHNYGAGKVVPPTCTEEGYTRFECTRCGDVDKRSIVNALGHKYGEGTEVAATCTEDAHTAFHCTREGCEEVKKENIQEGTATGHSFGQWIETETGELQHICSVCGETETYTGTDIPADVLKITHETSRSETDINGTPYKLYRISVGTGEIPEAYVYTINDYLDNGTLAYRYAPGQGLIITYEDGGDTMTVKLNPRQNDTYTVKAGASTDPTDPSETSN
ncbi:MAG: hypothetical protein J6L24_03765 [Oscillospiraceae bacterium]|nr:hypothetical protein [Oscillospiraceae bacterium]